MKIFGFVGWSGSGKTTLIKVLLPELISRGLSVSTIKHTHHKFDIDKPGKDSYEHRVAGANEVLICGTERWAILHENRDQTEPSMDELISRIEPVDLVLIEGFKRYSHDKLEVFRQSHGKELIAKDDKTIVAVATDEPLANIDAPILDLNNITEIADFIMSHCGLSGDVKHGTA